MTDVDELFEPRVVNGYTLVDILGSGGTAIAYTAKKDGKSFCVREHKFGKVKGRDGFKHFDLFEREYEVLRGLDHPYIPKVHDFFEVQEGRDISLYMVQDLVAGKCLEQLLKEKGVFTEENVLDIMLQLTGILEYTHSRAPAVVHRDIKPSNLMMDEQGKIYLIDFGIVQQEIVKTMGGSTSFGTLGYSAPEVFAGMAMPQSDLYSVGATALTLLSGISIDQMMHGFEVMYDQKVKFGNSNLKTVVDALIPVRSEDRIQSAEQLREYITQILEGKTIRVGRSSSGVFVKWLASLVPEGVVRTLAHTRSGVIDDARRQSLLITMDEPVVGKEKPAVKGEYVLMPQTDTYALGVEALRQIGQKPLTFKETILARVEAYESGDKSLFDTWLDSCTGIVYKSGTTKFKIVPNCEQLRTISKDFSGAFLPITYDAINASIERRETSDDNLSPTMYATIDLPELDSTRGKYNTLLTYAESLEHPGWLAALEGDRELLKTYTNIVSSVRAAKYGASDKLMGFLVRQNTPTDELNAAFVHSLNYNSNAVGSSSLVSNGRFLARR